MLQSEEQLVQIAALIAGMEGTNKEVADALNAKTVMRYKALSSRTLNRWMAMFPGTRKLIFQAAEDYASPYFDVCAAAKSAFENYMEPTDLGDDVTRGMVSLLPISDEAKAALLALAEDPISPAQEAGLPEMMEGYVQEARKL